MMADGRQTSDDDDDDDPFELRLSDEEDRLAVPASDYLRKAEAELQAKAELQPDHGKPRPARSPRPASPRPRNPLAEGIASAWHAFPLGGLLLYPFRISNIGILIPVSLTLIVSDICMFMMLGPGAALGMIGARLFGPPAFASLVLGSAYLTAGCLLIIDVTAAGGDDVEDWPAFGQWKEWCWSFLHVLVLTSQVGLVAFLVTCFLTPWTYLPTLFLTLLLLPPGLLAGLEAESWIPFSPRVFSTFATHRGTWLTFYALFVPGLVAWMVVTVVSALVLQLWFVFLGGPLTALAAVYAARLTGYLARAITR